MQNMSNYKEERLQRIAKNETKFEALEISRKASSLRVNSKYQE